MSTASRLKRLVAFGAMAAVALHLSACSSGGERHVKTGSVSIATVSLMSRLDMPRSAPILIRLFKEEAVLEVWKRENDGRYGLLRSYPICRFSGKLGPKIAEGDHQAPEGFYELTLKSLNPWSRNHLALNTGFPNAFDRSLGRTGSHLMVHGGCKSVGCYAMTNQRIEEIYGLVREALKSGQASIQLQAYPFRMTDENMRRHADDPNMPFWMMLKRGYDMFAATRRPPHVAACSGRYGFSTTGTSDEEICSGAAYAAAAMAPRPAYGASSGRAADDDASAEEQPAPDGESGIGDQFEQ